MPKIVPPRPFLKWAGGKTQLCNELLNRTPDFGRYLEPFVGGGALFFALVRAGKIKRAYLSDLNTELIDTYLAIRDSVDELIPELSIYEHKKDFFYDLRALDPDDMTQVKRAARMIYLNKTCYNGLYRVNQQGKFNVPFGSYKSPLICDRENLLRVAEALQNIEIECASFEAVVKKARKNDFVYFDPPYEPLSKTANFTSYQPGGFNQEAQTQLQQVCEKLHSRQVKFMLSNSAAGLIRELYNGNGYQIDEVKANRAINSNPKRRGKLTELIVTNYPIASKNS